MNSLKNAIIIRDNRLGKDVDKCDDIESIVGVGGKFDIVFRGSDKVWGYSRSNVNWITNPTDIPLADKYVYLNGVLLTSAEKVLRFGDWYKIFYEGGKHNTYSAAMVTIKKTVESEPLVKDTLSYLREVAEYLKSVDDEEGGDFLSKQIEKLRPVDGCALARFLQKARIKSTPVTERFIYPFGCNYSQMQAVKRAFAYDLSVIQGPPGTGKTQTILNIVANALLNGKTVAVVSGNNEATRNVAEKIDKFGLSFLTAFLGNRENIEKFFSAPPSLSDKIPEWARLQTVGAQELSAVNSRLETALEYQIRLPKIKKQIEELKIEKALSDEEYAARERRVPDKIKRKHFSSADALRTAALLQVLAGKEKVGLLTKLSYFFTHGITLSKELCATLGDTIDYLQNKFYALKLSEMEAERTKIEAELAAHGVPKLLNASKGLGRNTLLRAVAARGTQATDDAEITIKNYRSRFANFTKRFPIIFSTTNALQSCTGEGFLYDYLIIDEASQVNILTACIAFACARNVILVGDKKQLPHVVKTDDVKPLKAMFARYALPKEIEYCTHSILDAVTEMYGNNVPSTLLNEHYRCDPQIIGFCNKRFYDDSLIVQTTHKNDNCGIKIITTEAHHANNRTNARQAEIIARDILPEVEGIKATYEKLADFSVGIVAPYRNQVRLLQERFAGKVSLIDTVHKFQGKEKTVVIMSTVSDRLAKYEDDARVDFLNNPNLINVAISRAGDILYVIASTELLEQEGALLNDLAKYQAYYCGGGKRRHTTVFSVFDLMYDEYSAVLAPLQKRLLKISKHQSENIIATVIDDICKSKRFGLLRFLHDYPLRKVLDTSVITDAEDLRFARHPHAHCDFVIYDVLNKEIRLTIEVDGKQHETDPVQKARDERKDRLLAAAGIRTLRLPTTSMDCQEKIEGALR